MSKPENALARVEMPSDPRDAGMMIGVLAPALLTTLRALAAQHGNKKGEWFDQITSDLIRKAKGNEGVGVPMQNEAAGIKLGLNALDAIFDVVRRDLT
jgi:hypothetical protein